MNGFDREAVAGLGAESKRAAQVRRSPGDLASSARCSAYVVLLVLIPGEGFALCWMCCLLGWWPRAVGNAYNQKLA